jgi:NADPH:quinone reductase-like Zn-dependent oxidoreductase
MKAIVYRGYGSPDVLNLENIKKPVPKDNEVLIKIHAATVGTWDCEARSFTFPLWFWLPLRIAMGLRKPRWPVLGQDLSGEIESVGSDVERFKKGDRIYASTGLGFGAHAEYKCLRDNAAITIMPANMSYPEAAGIPTGGLNALHFLRKADIQHGQRVLVNGAAGNIGVIAVQLAKVFGAHVTAVDSAEKLDMLRSIGADEVVDYAEEDFTTTGETYDVIFDLVFKSSFSACIESLEDNGCYLLANPPFLSMVRALWTSRTTNKRVVFEFAGEKPTDLIILRDLIEAGKVSAVIDRCYPLDRAAEAHAYVDTGRRKGVVVLSVDSCESAEKIEA